jgi:polyisoprenoid-binding protein YceI
MHFDPARGKAGGEIAGFLASGESGNNSRDACMHNEILETAKYAEAVFRPSQVEGTVRPGPSDVKLNGVFTIHGRDHELTAQVHAELVGDRLRTTSKLDVPYGQWGVKDASTFLLKVKPVIEVQFRNVRRNKQSESGQQPHPQSSGTKRFFLYR